MGPATKQVAPSEQSLSVVHGVFFCAEPVAVGARVADGVALSVGVSVGVGELVTFFILGVGDGFGEGMTTTILGKGMLLIDAST